MATLDLSSLQIDLSGLDIAGIPSQPQQQGGILDRGLNALRSGVAGIAESAATTTEELGLPGAETIRGLAPQLPQGYQSPGARFLNQGGQGYDWNAFLEAIVEQLPQLGVSGASMGAGAVAGGAVAGPLGAAAGAALGPLLANAYQQLGPIARERAQRAGKPAPDREDWAWAIAGAAASGVLDAIGIGRLLGRSGGGVISRVASEAATEGLQSVTEQATSTANTPGGLEIDPKQALGEALIGGGAGAGPAMVARGVERAGQVASQGPTRATTQEDVELAQRLQSQTQDDGSPIDLSLRDRGVVGGAATAVQNVRKELLEEARLAHQALQRLARLEGDTDALRDLNVFKAKAFDRNDTNASEEDFRRIEARFGDTEEGQRLISLARQRARLQPFLQPQGTYGGLSAYTRFLDPTERTATGFQRAIGTLANIGLGGTGFLINRAARGIDRLTGRYSPVERFVRSAEGADAPVYAGESAEERIEAIREARTRTAASDEVWQALAAQESERLGREVSPDELRKRAQANALLAKMRRDEEAIANAAMGEENRQARSARNQSAQEALLAAQARRRIAESNAATAERVNTSKEQIAALKVTLADLNNQLAQNRLTVAQANARVAEALAANNLEQSNLRTEIMEIQRQLAERKLTTKEANSRTRRVVEQAANAAPEATPETTEASLNAREDATAEAPKPSKEDRRRAEFERFSALAEGIKAEIRAAREEGRRADFSKFSSERGFSGALKRAYGQLATEIRSNLINDPDPSVGPEIKQDVLDRLRAMDTDSAKTPDRRRMLGELMDIYGDYEANSPWLTDAFRAGRYLVEAGNDPEAPKPAKEPKASPAPNVTVNVQIPGLAELLTAIRANAYVQQGSAPKVEQKPVSTTPPDPVEEGQTIKEPPANPTPAQTEAEKAVEQKEKRKRGRPKKTVGDEVLAARQNYARAFELAKEAPRLDSAIQAFRDERTDKGLIKALILEQGTDHVTTYQLVNAFAKERGITQREAVEPVLNALNEMRKDGDIAAFLGRRFVIKGRQQRDKENAFLQDTVLAFKDKTDFANLLEISKARAFVGRTPDVRAPHPPFSPENGYRSATSVGIDGFTPAQKAAAGPLIEALNRLRSMGNGINRRLIDDVLMPLVNSTEDNQAFSKAMKPKTTKPEGDKMNARVLGLLLHELAGVEGNVIYQEAHADSRGRIYMRNGVAWTQGGDLMKALTRAPFSAPPTRRGLEHLFHSWGNIVGTDGKASIKDRRSQYVAAIPSLLKLAKNPFPKDGKYDPDVERILDVEGPFQAIAVARDTADMVEFASKRHPGFKPEMLDPNSPTFNEAVFNDIAENWKTDAIAQFDGNNNAFQIMGAFSADTAVLMGTSMMPRPTDNPDPESRPVADIYVEPAAAAVRTGFMDALSKAVETPEGRQWLRSVVKNSITTYVYDSSPQGAAATVFKGFLEKGYQDWIPQSYFDAQRENVKRVGSATEFTHGQRSKDGQPVRYRVTKNDGKFELLVEKAGGKGWRSLGAFDSQKEALDYPVLNTLAHKLTGEIRRQVNQMYPGLAASLKFFRDVVRWSKEQGGIPIHYTTPDGIQFTYELDEVPSDGKWDSIVVKQGRLTYRLPIVDGKSLSGRGLAANVTHAHDAWVLRTALKESGVRYMNPIHDSFGFHPSEAEVGIISVLRAMASLASNGDYNVFLDIVKRNNIPYVLDTQVEDLKKALIGDILLEENPKTSKKYTMAQAQEEAERRLKKLIIVPTKKVLVNIDPNQIRNAVS